MDEAFGTALASREFDDKIKALREFWDKIKIKISIKIHILIYGRRDVEPWDVMPSPCCFIAMSSATTLATVEVLLIYFPKPSIYEIPNTTTQHF